jgi:hypothetical protein
MRAEYVLRLLPVEYLFLPLPSALYPLICAYRRMLLYAPADNDLSGVDTLRELEHTAMILLVDCDEFLRLRVQHSECAGDFNSSCAIRSTGTKQSADYSSLCIGTPQVVVEDAKECRRMEDNPVGSTTE